MTTIGELLTRIETYCREAGVAESTFGRLAVNDGKLVARLRAGKSINLNTLFRIEAALSGAPATSAELQSGEAAA